MATNVPSPVTPPRRPVRGTVYKVAGWLMLAASGLLGFAGISIGTEETPGSLVLAVVLLFAFGGMLVIRGKKHSVIRGEELLRQDARPPILYLRSFNDETGDNRVKGFLGESLFGRQMALGTSAWAPREQEELAALMNKIGPYVAIGRPGEPLPELGAARLYVSDEEWQRVVGELIGRAKLVLVRAGRTEGLRWEVGELARRLSPTQLLFILPSSSQDYEQFRSWANRILSGALPEKLPKEKLLSFDRNWRPLPLPTRGTLKDSLAPFLAQNNIRV